MNWSKVVPVLNQLQHPHMIKSSFLSFFKPFQSQNRSVQILVFCWAHKTAEVELVKNPLFFGKFFIMDQCRIRAFFEDQDVLVTGVTGFLGKVLIEKLLRACPEVKTVFVLLRTNEKADQDKRMMQLMENSIFDKLKSENPAVLKKIRPICGTLEQPSLGLSFDDRQLLISNVTTVIHLAASIKFAEPLAAIVEVNTKGTSNVVKLCKEMKKLVSFVHVSTAFSNCHVDFIEEKIYPEPPGCSEILNLLMENKSLNNLSPEVLLEIEKCRPNTYVYSKALAEQVVAREANNLPVCIVRPSIVSASWKEPVPGWTDNVNSPTGLILGIGSGLMRIFAADPKKCPNMIPVDMACNMILCAAWETSMQPKDKKYFPHKLKVYNCCSSVKNPLTNGQMCNDVTQFLRWDYPFSKAVRYPLCVPIPNKMLFYCEDFAFQYVPAVIHDFLTPWKKFRAVKLYQKVMSGAKAVSNFSLGEWKFDTGNAKNLHEKLNSQERANFYFNVDEIKWREYNQWYCRGVRKFIVKDDDSSLKEAKCRMNRIFKMTVLFKVIAALCLVAVLKTVIGKLT